MQNDLLTDLEESHHEHLLREGNLRKKAIQSVIHWQPDGFIARISRWSCACGESGHSLIGVFAREKSLDGTATREKAIPLTQDIDFFPSEHPVQVFSSPTQMFCPVCLPVKGFMEFSHE